MFGDMFQVRSKVPVILLEGYKGLKKNLIEFSRVETFVYRKCFEDDSVINAKMPYYMTHETSEKKSSSSYKGLMLKEH